MNPESGRGEFYCLIRVSLRVTSEGCSTSWLKIYVSSIFIMECSPWMSRQSVGNCYPGDNLNTFPGFISEALVLTHSATCPLWWYTLYVDWSSCQDRRFRKDSQSEIIWITVAKISKTTIETLSVPYWMGA